MKRKIFNLRNLSKDEVDMVNKGFEELYQHKIEETKHTTSASTNTYNTFRETETGVFFQNSATATTFTATVNFQITYANVYNFQITPIGTATNYFVQEVNETGAIVKVVTDATSDSIKFFWRTTGSLE